LYHWRQVRLDVQRDLNALNPTPDATRWPIPDALVDEFIDLRNGEVAAADHLREAIQGADAWTRALSKAKEGKFP
jgi:hypothetical protein